MNRLLVIGSSPHIRTDMSTQKLMGWVIAALLPAGAAGVFFLGTRALLVIAVCVAICVITEAVWQKSTKQTVTVSDLSAVVTGVLLAYNLPPTVPLWMAGCGSVFSMVIAKHFFGGLGQNIVNPALAGRAMMLICWPVAMTTWTVQSVSGPTPLAALKGGEGVLPPLFDVFIGNVGGCIGETSALAILLGAAVLIYRGVISWRIPLVYILTVAVMAIILGRSAGPLYEILTGGLMLGAFFMATDYTTSPMTAKGHVVFAFGCGVITSLIRTFGGYPEGVSYSILIMNLAVPIIDRFTMPQILGEVKKRGDK